MKSKQIKLLTLTALFAAMTAALTFFPKIPVGAGYIHMGDSLIFIGACLLPPHCAMLAAAIGGGLADWFGGYPAFILPTMLIKAAIVLPYSAKPARILVRRNFAAILVAGTITIAGYMAAFTLLFGEFAAAVAWLPGGLVQVGGSSAMFVIIAAGLDRTGFKSRITKSI